MEYTTLGKTNIRISKVGVGTWQWGSKEWGWGKEYLKEDLKKAFERAIDLGINFFDTAEIYGGGKSEKMLGEFISGRRDDVVIASKVSPTHLRYKSVIKACNRSLERLNTEFIDLYQVHWPNPVIPMKSTAKAMDELVRLEKIRSVGVSNFSLKRMIAFDSFLEVPLASNQVRYGLLHRKPEINLLPYCNKNKIALIAYSPLDKGAISGKYNASNLPKDWVRRMSFIFTSVNMHRIHSLIVLLGEIADKYGVKPINVALRYLIDRGAIPIVGIKKLEQVEDLALTFEFKITNDENNQISETLITTKITKLRALPSVIKRLIFP